MCIYFERSWLAAGPSSLGLIFLLRFVQPLQKLILITHDQSLLLNMRTKKDENISQCLTFVSVFVLFFWSCHLKAGSLQNTPAEGICVAFDIAALIYNLYRNSATRSFPLWKCRPVADPLTTPNSGPFTDHTYNTVPKHRLWRVSRGSHIKTH